MADAQVVVPSGIEDGSGEGTPGWYRAELREWLATNVTSRSIVSRSQPANGFGSR